MFWYVLWPLKTCDWTSRRLRVQTNILQQLHILPLTVTVRYITCTWGHGILNRGGGVMTRVSSTAQSIHYHVSCTGQTKTEFYAIHVRAVNYYYYYYYMYTYIIYGPGSSVGIATCYGLNGSEIESRWGRDFQHLSKPALGPTQPPVQWVLGLSRG
jgi:hypothetical protein